MSEIDGRIEPTPNYSFDKQTRLSITVCVGAAALVDIQGGGITAFIADVKHEQNLVEPYAKAQQDLSEQWENLDPSDPMRSDIREEVNQLETTITEVRQEHGATPNWLACGAESILLGGALALALTRKRI